MTPQPIYLAARYSRREELCGYAADLRALGHGVTDVTAARIEPGVCNPALLSEGQRPAHHAAALYAFVRHRPDGFESRMRCWRHRPEWAR